MFVEKKEPCPEPMDRPAGTVVPWPEQRRDLPAMTGDEQLVERTWTEIDAWTYAFLWHCVVSF